MSIKPLNHYAIETPGPCSVYDEEAMTALELAGRTANKVNETVEAFNKLEKDVPVQIANDVNKHIKDGDFDDQIDRHTDKLTGEIRNLKQTTDARLDALVAQVVPGSTSGDAELADMRLGVDGKQYGSAGQAVRGQLGTLPVALPAIEAGVDLNNYTKSGNYILATSEPHTNGPVMQNLPRFLIVEGYGQIIPDLGDIQTWGKQTVISEGGVESYHRFYQWDYQLAGYRFFDWCSTNKNANARVLEGVVDLDTVREPNNYIVAITDAQNAPFTGNGFLLTVEKISGWYVQEVHGLLDDTRHFIRTGSGQSWGAWCEISNRENMNLAIDGVDLNQVVETRTYIVATTEAVNGPADIYGAFMLRVTSFGVGWVLQEAFEIHPGTRHFYRTGHNHGTVTQNFSGANIEWSEWFELATIDQVENIVVELMENLPTGGGGSGYMPCSGYTIVNLGDSIFADEQGVTSVSNYIAQATGATVINGAFGGTRATDHLDGVWDMFDLDAVVTAIADKWWWEQKLVLERESNAGVFPSYFADTIARLEATDFSKVDIVTINHGTNDWAAGVGAMDYGLALMNSVSKLQSAYPHLRIVLIGLLGRFDNVKTNTDPMDAFDSCLADNSTMQGCVYINPRFYPVSGQMCLENLYNLGMNEKNYTAYYKDGVHLNTKGRRAYANFISNTLRRM